MNIAIRINQSCEHFGTEGNVICIDNGHRYEYATIYLNTCCLWRLNRDRAAECQYVLGVRNGVVISIYKIEEIIDYDQQPIMWRIIHKRDQWGTIVNRDWDPVISWNDPTFNIWNETRIYRFYIKSSNVTQEIENRYLGIRINFGRGTNPIKYV